MLTFALALMLPAHAEPALPDDPAWWEEQARAVLAGPTGCVDVRGDARLQLVFVRPGGLMGPGETVEADASGPFSWRIRDGRWVDTQLEMKSKGDGPDISMSSAYPITGRVGDVTEDADAELSISMEGDKPSIDMAAEGGRHLNMVDEILEELRPDATLSWVEPRDAGGYVLVQRAPVPGAVGDAPLEIRTAFPDKKVPTAVDVRLPRKVRIGEGLAVATLMDAQVHLRAAQTDVGLVPVEEGMSLVVGFFGFTLGVEQHIAYTAMRRCPTDG
jgi:hypothetical protein